MTRCAWELLYASKRNQRGTFFCRCVCGTVREVFQTSLLSGKSLSCGCLGHKRRAEKQVKHGHARKGLRSKEHGAWVDMNQRCHNPEYRQYHDYGGRGIHVTERWRGPEGFANFLADLGPAPAKHLTLERIENEKGYCPENCKWATRAEQNRNKRPPQKRSRQEPAGANPP